MLQKPFIYFIRNYYITLWKYKERFHKIFRYLIFLFFFCFNVKAKLARPRLANPAIRTSFVSTVPVFGNWALASSDLTAVFWAGFSCVGATDGSVLLLCQFQQFLESLLG